MDARTYRAPTMALALAEVKRDLGAAAVILRTRSFKAGGFLGLGSHEVVEITASGEIPTESGGTELYEAAACPDSTQSPAIGADQSRARLTSLLTRAELSPADAGAATAIREDLASIQRLVVQLRAVARGPAAEGAVTALSAGGLPEPLFACLLRLQEARVPADVADRLIKAALARLDGGGEVNEASARAAVVAAIAEMIPVSGGFSPAIPQNGRPYTIALIGPTGVGKTTTLAKLAAAYRLRHGVNVGLLACDTYRIGAVEQVRTYADIIGVPLAVADGAGGVPSAMDALRGCRAVIVDTPGRSQRDSARLAELAALLDALGPHEVHLVLAAAAAEDSALRAIDAFGALRPDRLILSKLDEAAALGPLLTLTRRAAVPLSFLTTGQEVPDDLRLADGAALARSILDASISHLSQT